MEKVLLVAAGGAVGAVARYALGVQALRLWGPNWPFGTFIANVSGGLLMGVGGVMAMGCTIGQGLSGVSTLSLGSFIALAGIVGGAVLALRYQMWRLERMA